MPDTNTENQVQTTLRLPRQLLQRVTDQAGYEGFGRNEWVRATLKAACDQADRVGCAKAGG